MPSVEYASRSYVQELDTALWLPRHPLRTLDLEDTIDRKSSACQFSFLPKVLGLSGQVTLIRSPLAALLLITERMSPVPVALESSLGGEGKIGTWDGEECEYFDDNMDDDDYFTKPVSEEGGQGKEGGLLTESPQALAEVSKFPTRSPPASPEICRSPRSPGKVSLPRHPRLTGNER